MKIIEAVFTGALLLSCAACIKIGDSEARSFRDEDKLTLVVVGDGVETTTPVVRDHPLNNAQGRAMWNGAKKAFDSSERLDRFRKYVQIEGRDDGGSEIEADRIAREVRADPKVLAVIGHATSGTTRAAAHIYADAGIPLLMPIATSPNAIYPPGTDRTRATRLANCFRLPLSDTPYQAAMVAFTALKTLKTKRCYLLRDVSEDAAEYSGPLYSRLEVLLGSAIVAKKRINRDQTNIPFIAESVLGYNVDLIVFCGYGTTAQELMHALRVAYNGKVARPHILLTDGCKTREVDPSGFEVYVTFPSPDIFAVPDNRAPSKDLQRLRMAAVSSASQSYEMYGYDAVLLFAHALEKCRPSVISRDCIMTELTRQPLDVSGVLFNYAFSEGENISADYSLYSNLAAASRRTPILGSTFSLVSKSKSEDLRQFDTDRSRAE